MKKFNVMAAILSSVLMVSAAMPVFAGEDEMPKHGMHQMHGMKMFKGLNLTEAQKTQIEQLTAAHRATMPDKAAREANRKELKALLATQTFDEAGVRVLLEKQQAQRLEAEVAQLKFQHQLRAVLTPEQQVKLDKRKSRMKHKLREKVQAGE
jgi:periplasmic protein CpxP/Spy